MRCKWNYHQLFKLLLYQCCREQLACLNCRNLSKQLLHKCCNEQLACWNCWNLHKLLLNQWLVWITDWKRKLPSFSYKCNAVNNHRSKIANFSTYSIFSKLSGCLWNTFSLIISFNKFKNFEEFIGLFLFGWHLLYCWTVIYEKSRETTMLWIKNI